MFQGIGKLAACCRSRLSSKLTFKWLIILLVLAILFIFLLIIKRDPVDEDEDEDISTNRSISAKEAEKAQLALWEAIKSMAPISSFRDMARSDQSQVLYMFQRFFLKPRRSLEDKVVVREDLMERLKELGLGSSSSVYTSKKSFMTPESNTIVTLIPGPNHQSPQDRLLLVGAHYDTVGEAPGVEDNGSGCVTLLELARLISSNRCHFNYTIMLVWLDNEEIGYVGSQEFVNNYLWPQVINKYGGQFVGAYILDMVLVRDRADNSQTMPQGVEELIPEFINELKRDNYRGDFITAISRKTYDEPLEMVFRDSWLALGYENRTLKGACAQLPQVRQPNWEELSKWSQFLRSDHANFWFTDILNSKQRRGEPGDNISFNALFLTDLGPFRKSFMNCYHKLCDDKSLLTKDNLNFMQQTIDSLLLTMLRLGHGQCKTVI